MSVQFANIDLAGIFFHSEIAAARQLQVLLDMKMPLIICLAGSLSFGLFCAVAEPEVSAGVSIHVATDFYELFAANGTCSGSGHGRAANGLKTNL